LKPLGKGYYSILNRKNHTKALECNNSGTSHYDLAVSDFSGKDNQIWRIDESYLGQYKITNKLVPSVFLSVNAEENKAGMANSETGAKVAWNLREVCELKQKAFRSNTIPGIIEAEDFDTGCPEDAYFDKSEINEGGQYRPGEAVDIEKCAAGGFNVGWTHDGEWMSYTVNIAKSATYQASFYIATTSENARLHLECEGTDKTGTISIPNTAGYQNWNVVRRTLQLDAGRQIFKLVVDVAGLNIDKMVFEEVPE
jgi:hypothetical protein